MNSIPPNQGRDRRPSEFMPIRRRDSNTNRTHLSILRRRSDHLSELIRKRGRTDSTYMLAERAALKWALEILGEWMDEDPYIEVDWTGTEFTDNATLDEIVDLLGTIAVYDEEDYEIVGARPDSVRSPRPVVKLLLRPLDPEDASRSIRLRSLGRWTTAGEEALPWVIS